MANSDEIKIDKNIQMPAKATRGKYPWQAMEIGESFLAPQTRNIRSIASAASYASKKYKRKFSVRKTDDGYRCWRIA